MTYKCINVDCFARLIPTPKKPAKISYWRSIQNWTFIHSSANDDEWIFI